MQTCKRCQSKKWIVGQFSIILVVLAIIMVILVWMSKRKIKKTRGISLIDMVLSKLKIVIGFYQVTSGLLQAFPYIKWPDALEAIAQYSEILQLNFLQITPFNCLFPRSHVDAFGSLFAMMAINVTITGLFGISYTVRKMIVIQRKTLDDEEKSRKISETKELVYRNLFFVLYVTYLSTFSKTAAVMPLACHRLCRDEKQITAYSAKDQSISTFLSEPTFLLHTLLPYLQPHLSSFGDIES